MNFLEFAERHGFALIPLNPGVKTPVEKDWPNRASRDPAHWRAWQAAQFNLGIHVGASRLVIVDVDTTRDGGRDGAWQRYASWCESHGLAPFAPHCSTARQGMHVYFALPADADSTALRGRDLDTGINVLAGNRFAVAPGSNFEGLPYSLFPDAPPPYLAPSALVEHCTRAKAPDTPPPPPVEYETKDVAALVTWLTENGEFESYDAWVQCGMALKSACGEDGRALWELTFDGTVTNDVADAKWQSFATDRPGGVTIASLMKRAHAAGWTGRLQRTLESQFGNLPAIVAPPVVPTVQAAFHVIDATALAGRYVPPRRWHVPDLIPSANVTMLSGDGGTGKSLIATQLAVSTVTDRNWLGHRVAHGRALFASAEDSEEELHRRLADIVRDYRVGFEHLTGLQLVSLAGKDAVLAAPEPRSSILKATDLFVTVKAHVNATRPALVVLDTLADLFGGSELDRAQARQFIGLLRGLALDHECAVLLLAHPSMSGIASGTGASGSTAWNNSVRSRLYFERIRGEGGSEPDPDARVLRTVKANYGRTGGETVVHWRNGVFVPERVSAGTLMAAHDARKRADDVFLRVLAIYDAQDRGAVSPNPGANYAPKVFAEHEAAQGLKRRELRAAMDRLLASGEVEVVVYGPPSRLRQRLIAKSASNAPANAIPTISNGVPTPIPTAQ